MLDFLPPPSWSIFSSSCCILNYVSLSKIWFDLIKYAWAACFRVLKLLQNNREHSVSMCAARVRTESPAQLGSRLKGFEGESAHYTDCTSSSCILLYGCCHPKACWHEHAHKHVNVMRQRHQKPISILRNLLSVSSRLMMLEKKTEWKTKGRSFCFRWGGWMEGGVEMQLVCRWKKKISA